MQTNQHQWDLSSLYKSPNDPRIIQDRKKMKTTHQQFINRWSKRNDYLKDSKILLEALQEYENLLKGRQSGVFESFYWHLQRAIHQNDNKIIQSANKFNEFYREIVKPLIFFTNKLAKIPETQQKKFLQSKTLKKYHRFLQHLFTQGQHVLSEKEEALLLQLEPSTYSNWVNMTSKFLAKEQIKIDGKVLPLNAAMRYFTEKDNKKRRSATRKIAKIWAKYGDVATEELNSIFYTHKTELQLRKFSRTDEPSLINDDIDTQFVDTLLAVQKKFIEVSHRFYKFKTKLLNLRKLQYNDRSASIGEIKKKFTWEDSINNIYEIFNSFDPQVYKVIKDIVEKQHVDIYPRQDKSGGAFCAQPSKDVPVYVLLNHNDNLTSFTTIAHEFGHAVNFTLSSQEQPHIYHGQSLALAEVASTFFETLALDTVIKSMKDSTDRFITQFNKLDSFVTSVFRQLACYNMELRLHERFATDGYLPKETINSIFKQSMQEYLGNSVTFTKDEEYGWVYWSHIRYFFYVYSYASGLMISQSMLARYYQDKNFAKEVLYFLKQGRNKTPFEVFKDIGIDIRNAKFFEDGMLLFENELQSLEAMYNKLRKNEE